MTGTGLRFIAREREREREPYATNRPKPKPSLVGPYELLMLWFQVYA